MSKREENPLLKTLKTNNKNAVLDFFGNMISEKASDLVIGMKNEVAKDILKESKEQVTFDPIKARKLIDYHEKRLADHSNHHENKFMERFYGSRSRSKVGGNAHQHTIAARHHKRALNTLSDSLYGYNKGEPEPTLSHYKHGLKLSKKAKAYSAKLRLGA